MRYDGVHMKEFLNLLEPEPLVRAFLTDPPEGFTAFKIDADSGGLPAFLTRFDLSTTADKKVKKVLDKLKAIVPKPKTVFVGTTVSEYSLFPAGVAPGVLKERAVVKLNELKAPFLIIKDIPADSPVLSDEENEFSRRLVECLEESGFIIMHGQALAYVPINFASIEDYLGRFSRSRRKDFRRKLRSMDEVSIEAVNTGAPFFDDRTVELLYGLYLNVYERSYIHFDKLTPGFFRKVLKDASSRGVAFLYRNSGNIIGFNLCFLAGDYLIDKYVGFVYPESLDHNLYFISWFYNLEYCLKNGLSALIAGWTDPEIKAYLGAQFTHTRHAVYIRNPLLRFVLKRFKPFFESDRKVMEKLEG